MPQQNPSRWLRPLWSVAVAVALVTPQLTGVVRSIPGAAAASRGRVKVLGWGFDFPTAIAGDAQHLYVANLEADSVDVLDLTKGSLSSGRRAEVRVWYGSQHGFSYPGGLALYGGILWVLSYSDPYVSAHQIIKLTALDVATGKAEHKVTVPYEDGLNGPANIAGFGSALVINGSDLFVSDPAGNEVIELEANSGRLVRVIEGTQYDFGTPTALATSGTDLFVANATGQDDGSVTEIDAATGGLIEVIAGKQFHFVRPVSLATWGPYLFVVNGGKLIRGFTTTLPSGSVTEVNTYASEAPPPTSGTTVSPTGPPSTAPTSSTSSTSTTASTPVGTTTTSAVTATTMAGMSTTSTMMPVGATSTTTTTPLSAASPGATVVRVLSGPKFHLVLPGSAVVSNGQLLVTTSGGDFGAMVVINASTGALDEVLDRTSCQFESPTVAQLDDDNVFVANNIAGITQLHAGRCVGAVEGSRYGFHAPRASAVAGGELFVVNGLSFPSLTSSITELNASTGALSRVITQPEIGFEDDAVVAKGNSAYVVGTFGRILQLNASTGAVTRQFNEPNAPFGPLVTGAVINGATIYESELHGGLLALNTATGRMQQLLSEPDSNSESTESDGLPVPMVVSGNDLFYLGSTQSGKVFVEEVDTTTGKVARVISGPRYHLQLSSQTSVWGNDLVVTDPELPIGQGAVAVVKPPAGAVIEIDTRTGRLVRLISGARYDFQVPEGITVARSDIFVADQGGNAVTEVDPRTGGLVDVMRGAPYDFESPVGLDVYGDHLYVINELGESVTDIDLGA